MNRLDPPLKWRDFETLAVWMAEEIGDAATTYDTKRYYIPQKEPIQPPPLPYRKQRWLFHEERTLLALFIREIFCQYWQTKKTSNFAWQDILRKVARRIGMEGYERTPRLYIVCWQFVKKFPAFINTLESDGAKYVVIRHRL